MNYKRNTICTNCGIRGHILRECTDPITSFGIIAYRVINSKEEEYIMDDELEIVTREVCKYSYPRIKYLMIQRKDTIGYTDFIRGKYKTNNMLKVYFTEMTIGEQKKLLEMSFREIWDSLLVNHKSKTYINEYEYAKKKFESHDIQKLICMYPSQYEYQEFGFPKGRRNVKEADLDCATREFIEETNYSNSDYDIISDVTFTESFIGTDCVQYKHIYYIAKMRDSSCKPLFSKWNQFQVEEIRNIGFFSFDQINKLLRPYDTEKVKVITRINKYVEGFEGFNS